MLRVMNPGHRRPRGRPTLPLDKERVLEAACLVFAEDGYSGASLARIARRVGASKAALLYHYGTKEKLYMAALAAVVGELHTFVAAAGRGRCDGLTRLDRLGKAVTGYLASHPVAAKLLVSDIVLGGPFSRGPGRPILLAALNATKALLEQGMKEGAFSRGDAGQLAVSIAALHLLYFAVGDLVGEFLAGDVLSPKLVRARAKAVVAQARALLLGGGEAQATLASGRGKPQARRKP